MEYLAHLATICTSVILVFLALQTFRIDKQLERIAVETNNREISVEDREKQKYSDENFNKWKTEFDADYKKFIDIYSLEQEITMMQNLKSIYFFSCIKENPLYLHRKEYYNNLIKEWYPKIENCNELENLKNELDNLNNNLKSNKEWDKELNVRVTKKLNKLANMYCTGMILIWTFQNNYIDGSLLKQICGDKNLAKIYVDSIGLNKEQIRRYPLGKICKDNQEINIDYFTEVLQDKFNEKVEFTCNN